jgi:hypothetical protein
LLVNKRAYYSCPVTMYLCNNPRAEFSGLSGMEQMMKHSNSSSSADGD